MLERIKRALRGVGRAPAGPVAEAGIDVEPASGAAAKYVATAETLSAAGKLGEAIVALDTALSIDPTAAAAYRLLGAIAQIEGRASLAIGHYRKVLELDPGFGDDYRRLCLLLFQSNLVDEAKEVVVQGISACPAFADLHYFLGNLCVHERQFEAAVTAYGQALEIQTDYPEVHYNRGIALQSLGRPEHALASLDAALRLRPGYIGALVARGSVLRALGRHEEAVEVDDRVLAIRPDEVAVLLDRGQSLWSLKRRAEALASYRLFLASHPSRPDVLNNCGLLLQELGRPDEALADYDKALRLEPDFAAAVLNNRALALHDLRRFEEALVDVDRALQLEPELADAHANRGNVLQELVRHPEALAAYERAQKIRPTFEGVNLNESLSRLVLGDMPAGWTKYEWRWQSKQRTQPIRDFGRPRWSGRESLQGKSILIHAEQGLGDTIQFCRYAKLLSERGARVLLQVQPPLKGLLADLQGVSHFSVEGEVLPAFDFHCPLLSLPLAFATTLDSIPASSAYISTSGALRDRVEAWAQELGPSTCRRIGLVWSGNPNHKNDANRSIPLAEIVSCLPERAEYFSLQNEVRETDRSVLNGSANIHDVSGKLVDFGETAALIAQLDLVVAVDTSVAHLAGAMGKPLWLLLPANPDWRWLLDRNDSPWYDSARLFRQTKVGSWDDTLFTVKRELQAFVS